MLKFIELPEPERRHGRSAERPVYTPLIILHCNGVSAMCVPCGANLVYVEDVLSGFAAIKWLFLLGRTHIRLPKPN